MIRFDSIPEGCKFMSAGYWWQKTGNTSAKSIDAEHPYFGQEFEYKAESLIEYVEY